MAISDLMSISTAELLPIVAVIASFAVAAGFAAWVTKQKPGTKEMQAISDAVKEGASAFLRREMKVKNS